MQKILTLFLLLRFHCLLLLLFFFFWHWMSGSCNLDSFRDRWQCRHDRCLEETTFLFIDQVWFPYGWCLLIAVHAFVSRVSMCVSVGVTPSNCFSGFFWGVEDCFRQSNWPYTWWNLVFAKWFFFINKSYSLLVKRVLNMCYKAESE